MKNFLVLLPILYLFMLLLQVEKAFTQDLGRHLLLGQIILDCVCVPKINLFSYTAPNFPFINHHWIPEVVFYLIAHYINLTALLWIKIFLISASFILVLYLAVKKSSLWIASILSIPFIFIFSERFDARPEIFSFVFVSLMLFLLSVYRKTGKLLYLSPVVLIQLLWVNSHIYFFVGLLLLAFLAVDLVLRKKLNSKFILLFCTAYAVTMINPNGIEGAIYPLRVFGNYGYSIVENQNIFFLNSFFFNPRVLVFELLALVVLVGIVIQLKRKNYFFSLSMSFAVVAGFMMIRNFPLFVLIVLPGLAQSVSILLEKISPQIRNQIVGITASIFIIFSFVHSFHHIQSPYFGLYYISGAEKAVDFFKENKLSGRIFNNFDIGSYLIYRLYPEEKVFVDGRPEAYPASFFDEYKRMQTDFAFFKQQVIRYDINTVFFAHTDITPWAQAFLQTIMQDSQWVPVYIDERIVILLKNIPDNQDLIEKFRITN